MMLTTSELIAQMEDGDQAICTEGLFKGKTVSKSPYGIHDPLQSDFLKLSKAVLDAKWTITKKGE